MYLQLPINDCRFFTWTEDLEDELYYSASLIFVTLIFVTCSFPCSGLALRSYTGTPCLKDKN